MSSQIAEIPKPAVYDHPKAATALIAPTAVLVFIIFLLSIPTIAVAVLVPEYVTIPLVLDIVVVLVLLPFIFRTLWKWRHDTRELDPDDGNLISVEPMNMLLMVPGSDDDVTPLDDAKKVGTPGSKFVSEHFNSATLVIDGKVFTHVRDVQHILDIYQYRKSIKSRELRAAQRQEVLLESINDKLGQILTVMTASAAPKPPANDINDSGDDTGEIPVVYTPPAYRQDPWP